MFNNVQAIDLISFVRTSAHAVITDEAACAFSWTGQHDNIKIRNFKFTELLEGKIFLNCYHFFRYVSSFVANELKKK